MREMQRARERSYRSRTAECIRASKELWQSELALIHSLENADEIRELQGVQLAQSS